MEEDSGLSNNSNKNPAANEVYITLQQQEPHFTCYLKENLWMTGFHLFKTKQKQKLMCKEIQRRVEERLLFKKDTKRLCSCNVSVHTGTRELCPVSKEEYQIWQGGEQEAQDSTFQQRNTELTVLVVLTFELITLAKQVSTCQGFLYGKLLF